MATTSSTTKAKPDNQNLTRTRSIGRKPKAPSSVSSEDGSDQKPEKPLPNYLKPTISSRPDPVKFLKKNNSSPEYNQKLLRRRSFDRPPSSLTSPSTSSSPHIQKSLKVSPSLPRDRPTVPREKPVTAQRSSSFHGSRGVPKGGTTVKSPPVAPKKSGLSSSSSSSRSKNEGSSNVTAKKVADKEIPLDTASLASAQEDDQEEILKVESDVQVLADDIEEPKDEKVTKEVQVEAVQADESVEENVSGGQPTVASSPVVEDCIVVVANEDEKEELINEDKPEEKIEETKEQENNQDNKNEDKEEVLKKKIDDEHESPKKVHIDMKEVESVKETSEEKEEQGEKEEEKDEEVKEEEKEKVKEEEKEKVKEEEKEKVTKEEESKKKEVVKGKKESPSAYNDVIASKMQENPRKNKVLALAGAFQTVIDYETAASK